MAKLTLKTVLSGFNLNSINENFQALVAELQNKVLYRDNPSGEPNQWETQQDANSQRLINLQDAVSPSEPATLRQLNSQAVGVQSVGISRASVSATAGQTLFSTSGYVLGSNNLNVYVNGVRQAGSAYTETSTTSFTLSEGAQLGDNVEYIINELPELAGSVAASAVQFTQSGAGAVTSNVQTKLEEGVSIKDFGAVGDSTRTGGGTDDTAAIKACVASVVAAGGGKIFAPKGIYRITEEIDLAAGYGAPAIIFEGEGYGPWNQDTPGATSEHTTMFVNDSDTEHAFSIHSVGQTVIKNISLLDLRLGTRTSGNGINIRREPSGSFGQVGTVTGVRLQQISIKGFFDGVYGERLQTSKLEMLFIEDCLNDGVHLTSVAAGGTTSVLLTNVFVKECGRDNYYIDGHAYSAFNTCASDNSGRHGYRVSGETRDCNAISFTGCGFESGGSPVTGSDDTSSGAAIMTDSGASFTVNEFIGYIIHNITDGSSSTITSNTATTITGVLANGSNNNWDSGDSYTIGGAGWYFGTGVFGAVMQGCLTTGATSDAIYSKANGLTIIACKIQVADGYGLNMAAGFSHTVIGSDYASNTLGNTGGQTDKIMSMGVDLSNQMLMGHTISTGANNSDIVLRQGAALRSLDAAGVTSANFGIFATGGNDWAYSVPATNDTHIYQFAGQNRMQFEEMNGAISIRMLGEVSSVPANPAANQCRLFLLDDGGGKTQLMARFGTGAAQQIAIEP